MKHCFYILGYVFFLSIPGCDTPVHELYVSAKGADDGKKGFSSIDSALEEVTRIRQTGDIDLITIRRGIQRKKVSTIHDNHPISNFPLIPPMQSIGEF